MYVNGVVRLSFLESSPFHFHLATTSTSYRTRARKPGTPSMVSSYVGGSGLTRFVGGLPHVSMYVAGSGHLNGRTSGHGEDDEVEGVEVCRRMVCVRNTVLVDPESWIDSLIVPNILSSTDAILSLHFSLTWTAPLTLAPLAYSGPCADVRPTCCAPNTM